MEKIRITLKNGEDKVVEHESVDRTFDDIMQFQEGSHIVKTTSGAKIPIRNILYYQDLDTTTPATTTEESNG